MTDTEIREALAVAGREVDIDGFVWRGLAAGSPSEWYGQRGCVVALIVDCGSTIRPRLLITVIWPAGELSFTTADLDVLTAARSVPVRISNAVVSLVGPPQHPKGAGAQRAFCLADDYTRRVLQEQTGGNMPLVWPGTFTEWEDLMKKSDRDRLIHAATLLLQEVSVLYDTKDPHES